MRFNEINPFFFVFLLALAYFVFYSGIEYVLYQKVSFKRPIVGAIIFFLVYLAFRRYLNHRIEKKIKK